MYGYSMLCVQRLPPAGATIISQHVRLRTPVLYVVAPHSSLGQFPLTIPRPSPLHSNHSDGPGMSWKIVPLPQILDVTGAETASGISK